HQQQAPRGTVRDDLKHFVGGGCALLVIAHQLDGDHRAEATHIADQRYRLLPTVGSFPHNLADLLGALEQFAILEHLEHFDTSHTGQWIATVCTADPADVCA